MSVKAGMTDPIVEHRELLEEFFLEAFPNPDRVGCPDEDAMQALAENGPLQTILCCCMWLPARSATGNMVTFGENMQSGKQGYRPRC